MDPMRIAAAIHGRSESEFRELHRCYHPHVRFGVGTWLRKVARLLPYRDDIESQVWLRLLAHDRRLLCAYDPSKGSFEYFIELVAANTAWRVASEKKLLPRLWSPELDVDEMSWWCEEGDIEGIVADHELLTKLDELMKRELSAREVFILDALVGRERIAKDVGNELGMSEHAVWAAKSRAVKKLRELADKLLRDRNPGAGRWRGPDLVFLYLVSLGVDAVPIGWGSMHEAVSCPSGEVQQGGYR